MLRNKQPESQPLDIPNLENVFKLLPGSLGISNPSTLEELRDKGLVEVSRVMLLRYPENWRRNPVLEALSHKRGRKSHFLAPDGSNIKSKVARYVRHKGLAGWRPAEISMALYNNPNFTVLNWKTKKPTRLKMRSKTVLKWEYIMGIAKPGVPLLQRIFPRWMREINGKRREGAREEQEVYRMPRRYKFYLYIVMDLLGWSEDRALWYWTKATEPLLCRRFGASGEYN
jgi:hypothetical protein